MESIRGKVIVRQISNKNCRRNYDNDTEDEGEDRRNRQISDSSMEMENGSPTKSSSGYYRTNAMTIYNSNVEDHLNNQKENSGGYNQLGNSKREDSKRPKLNLTPQPPTKILALQSSGRDKEIRRSVRNLSEVAKDKKQNGLPKPMDSSMDSDYEPEPNKQGRGEWYRRASNYGLEDSSDGIPSSWNRQSYVSRSSTDLRSQSYLRDRQMNRIIEENSHRRTRSVEKSDNDYSSLETDISVINENQKGLWTDTELYTENSDNETAEGTDYVLDTTAYVCSVIDSIGLTEEERSKILMVVARDERLRIKEKQRIV